MIGDDLFEYVKGIKSREDFVRFVGFNGYLSNSNR